MFEILDCDNEPLFSGLLNKNIFARDDAFCGVTVPLDRVFWLGDSATEPYPLTGVSPSGPPLDLVFSTDSPTHPLGLVKLPSLNKIFGCPRLKPGDLDRVFIHGDSNKLLSMTYFLGVPSTMPGDFDLVYRLGDSSKYLAGVTANLLGVDLGGVGLPMSCEKIREELFLSGDLNSADVS